MRRAASWLAPALLLAGLAAVPAPGAHATSRVYQDLATRVDRAELIFVGTVLHAESVPTGDGTFAFTYVTFEVEDTVKGTARDRQLTLRFAGGDLGETVFEVAGIPRFAPGDRHLLFVEGNGKHGCPLVGWGRGKLDLVAHPLTGETIVVDSDGRSVVGIDGREWLPGGLAVAADGTFKAAPAAGMVVLEQENVEIVVDDPAAAGPGVAAATPDEVFRELRGYVQTRSSAPSYRQAPPVESASPADVPPSFHFQAYPAPRR